MKNDGKVNLINPQFDTPVDFPKLYFLETG